MWTKVNPIRDEYGFGLYEIAERNELTREVRLIHPNPRVPKKGFWLFEVHCNHNDLEARRKNIQAFKDKREAAQKIGLNKPRRKR